MAKTAAIAYFIYDKLAISIIYEISYCKDNFTYSFGKVTMLKRENISEILDNSNESFVHGRITLHHEEISPTMDIFFSQ